MGGTDERREVLLCLLNLSPLLLPSCNFHTPVFWRERKPTPGELKFAVFLSVAFEVSSETLFCYSLTGKKRSWSSSLGFSDEKVLVRLV